MVGKWCNLKACPPTSTDEITKQSHWTPERLAVLEKQLFDITGKTLSELFPRELRENSKFLNASKDIEATREIDLKLLPGTARQLLQLPDLHDDFSGIESCEARQRIDGVLKTLSYREREIIKLRYGLSDGHSYTLEEVGRVFKVTRERIHTIEANAIRKLQQPSRAAELVGL